MCPTDVCVSGIAHPIPNTGVGIGGGGACPEGQAPLNFGVRRNMPAQHSKLLRSENFCAPHGRGYSSLAPAHLGTGSTPLPQFLRLCPNNRLTGFAKATKTCRAAKLYWRPLNLKRSLPVLKLTFERDEFQNLVLQNLYNRVQEQSLDPRCACTVLI